MTTVTVWNEYRVEKEDDEAREVYPEGIHGAIADFLEDEEFDVQTATIDDPEHGLTEETLNETDVLTWWGHEAHEEVADEVVERVRQQVLSGMGLVVLHSGHFSKIFKRLMGTTCDLKWRNEAERERIWTVEPGHPIAEGVPESIEVPEAEMYGERFDVPAPDTLVFTSWFEGGEVFRSGCCYRRGAGRIFYFRPGHETYPIYHQSEIQQVVTNAVEWAENVNSTSPSFGNVPEPPEEG
ncbi:ThuA domain-containing protein [Halorussus lipolyticus]|uniref:ThuA domain-containing protein n=1 Tax=Halorussus lipolyticus TaxID=3034024 RepID=UPI0023E785CA|nr:ThuA domain-containing protein [Halorussus sp. DT80]